MAQSSSTSTYVNITDEYLPFVDACQLGNLAVVESVLKLRILNPAEYDNLAIRRASRYGHLEVVSRLLEDKRVNPAADTNFAIHNASAFGHASVVNRLLEDKRVNPADRNNDAIQIASAHGHLAVVNRLLEDKRVDPAVKGGNVIVAACAEGHLPVVKRLLEDKRVNPAAGDNCAIRAASTEGFLHIVNVLLKDKRVDPAAGGNSAVTAAVHGCHTDVAELLLKDERVKAAAVHVPMAAQNNISIPANPGHDMLHLLSRTLPLPFPADSCIIGWQPLIRRHRYHQLLRLETLIASKWHKEGEHRDVSEDVIAKYALGVTMQEYRVLDRDFDEAMIFAAVCDADGCCSTGKMQVCSRCKQSRYCSSACQKKDWAQHKKVCQKK
jgi:hypothetical protein